MVLSKKILIFLTTLFLAIFSEITHATEVINCNVGSTGCSDNQDGSVTLHPGFKLNANQSIIAINKTNQKQYMLVLQGDGSFVSYSCPITSQINGVYQPCAGSNMQLIWAGSQHSGDKIMYQSDGNFVKSAGGVTIADSKTTSPSALDINPSADIFESCAYGIEKINNLNVVYNNHGLFFIYGDVEFTLGTCSNKRSSLKGILLFSGGSDIDSKSNNTALIKGGGSDFWVNTVNNWQHGR